MLAALQAQMEGALSGRIDEADALALFKGDPQHRQQGLSLYRGNLVATCDKTLRAAYPVLHALVGDEFFSALTRAFGRQHPSRHGDLHHHGAEFAAFLAEFVPVAAYPYFADVARYEWALHRARFADLSPALDRTTLATCTPQQLENLCLCLHPASTLLTSPWAVSAIWRAHQVAQDGTMASALPQQLAVGDWAITVRPRWRVDLLPLSRAGWQALHCIVQGGSLGEAVDAALALDDAFALANHLHQWIDHAILCPKVPLP